MADQNQNGNHLIEEGTLLPESLQCESEPWTSFYTPVESFENCGRRLENKASMGLKWQRQSIRELSLSRMAYSYRTRCDSKASPVRPAWRLVKNLDGYGLGSKKSAKRMDLLWLAGEIGANRIRFDGQKTVRRAVKRNPGT